jgi:hypothetical protein
MLTRVDPSLDRPVVLFQNVIQVRHRPVPAIPLKGAFGFESRDRGRVRAVTVGVDDSRRRMAESSPGYITAHSVTLQTIGDVLRKSLPALAIELLGCR